MARLKTCTLHLELKVPTPVGMPKINSALIRAVGSGQRRLLRVPTSAAALCRSLPAPGLPVPNRNQAKHQFAAATVVLCHCYQGTSSTLCINIPSVLCFAFSGKRFLSTTIAGEVPLEQQWHCPQVLGLVTLQCMVFYSLGLEPDPLCTPAGRRPGLAITSLPPLPPTSFVCCIHLGSSEQAVYLLSGRVCAWFPVCAASQA